MDHSHHDHDHAAMLAGEDHSSHHAGMDHSHHHGHGSGSSANTCNMNMLFTWSHENLCIVFPQWRITSTFSLILSLVAIVALAAGYEAIREGVRRYETAVAKRAETVPRQNKDDVKKRAHVVKAVLYGFQNFYAFMIMLIFMTYNGWVMLACSIGAGLGYLIFGGETTIAKETACH
ncbi:Ctr copper transporter family-domain-containing protein [Podospora australis]|uniref:Copper transport protein n=1 Tax=Podospora australis TaxID=1536484 RepID=A0AAN6WNY7_9PEZI|nr:Ctr copper transporter family-domain-containing protein [Podospora australis]